MIVELREDGSPDADSERLVPARDVGVGANARRGAGQQVRSSAAFFFLPPFSGPVFRLVPLFAPSPAPPHRP